MDEVGAKVLLLSRLYFYRATFDFVKPLENFNPGKPVVFIKIQHEILGFIGNCFCYGGRDLDRQSLREKNQLDTSAVFSRRPQFKFGFH